MYMVKSIGGRYVQAGKDDYGSGKEREFGSCTLPEISVQDYSQEKRLLIWVTKAEKSWDVCSWGFFKHTKDYEQRV